MAIHFDSAWAPEALDGNHALVSDVHSGPLEVQTERVGTESFTSS